ncbi:MAG: aminoacyl-tRNA hydrolase [Thermoguttaceae bacterium]
MKLVVGLGNPGRKYAETRHNLGYAVLAELARKTGSGNAKGKFHGEVMEADLGGEKSLLLSPTTFMNLSGTSVSEARDFYKIPNEDLLVVCDDLNLPLAKLRIRSGGSAGGQKGLEDIIRRLGTEEFSRLRIGIGAPPPGWNASDFVLARFTEEEKTLVAEAIRRAAEAVVVWAREGILVAMNGYN